MISEKQEPILITEATLSEITIQSMKYKTKSRCPAADAMIRLAIKHIADVHGVDLGIETEAMRNERLERESKEDRKRNSKRGRLGRKKFWGDPDSF